MSEKGGMMHVASMCLKALSTLLIVVLGLGYIRGESVAWMLLPGIGLVVTFTTAFVLVARRRGAADAIDELLHGGYLEMPLRDASPADVDLTRAPDDKHRYSLGAYGRYFEMGGWAATAESGDRRWKLDGDTATDASGTVVGRFQSRFWEWSGSLHWEGRELWLRIDEGNPILPGGRLRAELLDGDRELVAFVGSRYRTAPLRVTVRDESIDRGLLLFATFLARDKTRPRVDSG